MATNSSSSIRIFDFNFTNASIRYGVILTIALINAHVRTANFYNYSFPMRSFINGLIFGGIICTASWIFTLIIRNKLFHENQLTFDTVSKFITANLIVGIAVYTALYLTYFGTPVSLVNFTAYLFIAISIIIIENLAFLLYSQLKARKKIDKPADDLLIKSGRKDIRLAFNDIAYAQVNNGIVKIHKFDQDAFSSSFQSLDELEELLPTSHFFRANRQTLINKKSIEEITHKTNRMLMVKLKTTDNRPEVQVSRYRKKDLLTWIKNN